ncbi:unnamed protein product [Didymodactylos carnosus]|uniref:Uncharacterized protein n=1 Tax=Didymodactylos carnosus TaxID=1234261 RepID=A0A8S2HNC6_9BILA|nr:unnamed protein product [Didymodactylos carnosus]
MKVILVVLLVLVSTCSIHCAKDIQEYVDQLLATFDDKLNVLDTNPGFWTHIYGVYRQQYPRAPVSLAAEGRSMLTVEQQRIQAFKANVKYILKHNDNPLSTFKLKINDLTDWTDDELSKLRSKIQTEAPRIAVPPMMMSKQKKTYPSEYDWTNQTRVPGAVREKTYAELYPNTTDSLSPQQIIDCSTTTNGCEGGSYVGTFSYIRENGYRLNSETDYPYGANGANQTCQKQGGVLLTYNSTYKLNYKQLPTENEETLKQVIYDLGPVYVYYNAGDRKSNDTQILEVSRKFDHYASGVYEAPGCCTSCHMNHAMVIVGYGTENGTDYWKLRNSWGPTWGDNGFIKIKRGVNMCGVATWPYYTGLF